MIKLRSGYWGYSANTAAQFFRFFNWKRMVNNEHERKERKKRKGTIIV